MLAVTNGTFDVYRIRAQAGLPRRTGAECSGRRSWGGGGGGGQSTKVSGESSTKWGAPAHRRSAGRRRCAISLREGLEKWRSEAAESEYCVANLSYVVDRRVRALPQRIAEMQHASHDIIASTMVLRLDHFHSLETVILKGATRRRCGPSPNASGPRGRASGSAPSTCWEVAPTDDHAHDGDHVHHGHQHLCP